MLLAPQIGEQLFIFKNAPGRVYFMIVKTIQKLTEGRL